MTGSPVAACERCLGTGWLRVFLEAWRSVAADDVPRPMIDEPFLTESSCGPSGGLRLQAPREPVRLFENLGQLIRGKTLLELVNTPPPF